MPQLEVPKVTPYKSEMGNDYIRERSLNEIVAKLMSPPVEEKEESEKEEEPILNPNASAGKVSAREPSTMQNKKAPEPKPSIKGKAVTVELEEEPVEEQEVKQEEPKFQMNDFMEKASKRVPQDPDGNETMHADLVISAEQIIDMLEQTLHKNLTWLLAEKQNYAQKVAAEGKELQDKSVEELDENLRKQWPR